MSLNSVRIEFDTSIDDIFKNKPDIIRFVKGHERKELVLQNLCEQILRCENFCVMFDVSKYKSVIKAVVKMFSENALKYAEEKLISTAEITRRTRESDRIKDAENMMLILEKEAKDERDKIKVFLNEHG